MGANGNGNSKPPATARTEGEILAALSYDYPCFGCFGCCLGWMIIRGPCDWLDACPKCGGPVALMADGFGLGKQPSKADLPAVRAAVLSRVAEARRIERECERDPRKRALEVELEAAAVALGIKGGRDWRRRLDHEHDAMPGPNFEGNCNFSAAYWPHLPRALRTRLECMDKLNWLVDQWFDHGLSGEPAEFDADLREMRRLLKLVKRSPYDVRAKSRPARRHAAA